jgi:membrane protein YdbS with pleckstrin-like domain
VSVVEVLIGVVLGLVVNEATDVSPWLGRALVGWSARLRYGDSDEGRVRGEELRALINVRPGKLFKLLTGAGFAGSALIFRLRRLLRPAADDSLVEKPLELVPTPYDEDEPSLLVARYLFPTERYRGEWRRHWIAVARSFGIIGLYGVLGIWVVVLRIKPQYRAAIVGAICALCLLLLAHRILNWYFDRFVITNKRLMRTRGLIYRRVEMIPLIRVTSLRYVQGALGRLLSYGTFRFSSGETRIRPLRDLPNPNELYLRVIEEVYEPAAVEARLGNDDDPGDIVARLKELSATVDALVVAMQAPAKPTVVDGAAAPG